MGVNISDEQRRGYQEQTVWLQGESIPGARHALAEREATQEANDFNAGATAATREYIARMEAFAARARSITEARVKAERAS